MNTKLAILPSKYILYIDADGNSKILQDVLIKIPDYMCLCHNLTLQYGRIAHIDLKIPPRPPGYAFVEVRFCFEVLFY